MNTQDNGEHVAVVGKIAQDSHTGGFYVVTYPALISEPVTFTLDKDTWKEEGLPEPGLLVVLDCLETKVAGHRALKARRYKPGVDDANPDLRNQREILMQRRKEKQRIDKKQNGD